MYPIMKKSPSLLVISRSEKYKKKLKFKVKFLERPINNDFEKRTSI
jgi:hypothetical protein